MKKAKTIQEKIRNDGLESLVGWFIDIDTLNNIFKEVSSFRKGKLGDNGHWHETIAQGTTFATSKMQVVNNQDEIYNIIVRNEEMTGSMIEDVSFAGHQTSEQTAEVTLRFSSDDLVEHHDLPQENFSDFVNWIEPQISDYLAENDFLNDYIKAFKEEIQ